VTSDFACVPVSDLSAELYPTPCFVALTHAAAFETGAGGGGRPVMVHRRRPSAVHLAIAAHYACSRTGLGRAHGYCGTGSELGAFRRHTPTAARDAVRRHGSKASSGRAAGCPARRPSRRLDSTLSRADGPKRRERHPVPRYVRPYDGCAWSVRAYLAAKLSIGLSRVGPGCQAAGPLAAQIRDGGACRRRRRVPRERLDDIPETPIAILPPPADNDHVWHVRTSFWNGASEFFAAGCCISCSGMPHRDGRGCGAPRVSCRCSPALDSWKMWSPFTPNGLRFPVADSARRSRRSSAVRRRPWLIDADGQPALVVAKRGVERPWCAPAGRCSPPGRTGRMTGFRGLYAIPAGSRHGRTTRRASILT
jgi:hypothetical protein